MKDTRVYLAHILECIGRIESYVAKGKEAFFAEPLIQDAVIRNFEVIGEAAKRVPDAYRLRDVLIHQYEGVSLPDLWQVIETELPILKAAIAALLPPLDELEREIAGENE